MKTDPATMDEIDENDRVVVSTGHQFDINNLIHFHDARDYKGTEGETPSSKWLLNPLTGKSFSPRDVTHIRAVAKQKKN